MVIVSGGAALELVRVRFMVRAHRSLPPLPDLARDPDSNPEAEAEA